MNSLNDLFNQMAGCNQQAASQYGNQMAASQYGNQMAASQYAALQNIALRNLSAVYVPCDERDSRNARNLALWRARFERAPLSDCEAH